MDRPNNQHSMVFRCEATWKERDAITRRFRRQANLSRFRDAASRDARRGPRIVMRARRKRAAAARGSAAASEPKIPEASARKAKRAKSDWHYPVRVCGVNRLFTQVRQHMSWPGKSYLKNNSRSFEIVVSLLESPVPVSGFCEDGFTNMERRILFHQCHGVPPADGFFGSELFPRNSCLLACLLNGPGPATSTATISGRSAPPMGTRVGAPRVRLNSLGRAQKRKARTFQ